MFAYQFRSVFKHRPSSQVWTNIFLKSFLDKDPLLEIGQTFFSNIFQKKRPSPLDWSNNFQYVFNNMGPLLGISLRTPFST